MGIQYKVIRGSVFRRRGDGQLFKSDEYVKDIEDNTFKILMVPVRKRVKKVGTNSRVIFTKDSSMDILCMTRDFLDGNFTRLAQADIAALLFKMTKGKL